MADPLFFNGIDALTGEYLLPPMDAEQLSAIIRNDQLDDDTRSDLRTWYEYITQGHYGVKEGIDPKKLEETGWGILFAFDEDQAVIDAMRPLMEWRKQQANKKHEFYREYIGGEGLRPNENKNNWLARHGAGPGPADPEVVPYYILLVGSPEKISYRFQTQLDVQYAVGRIHFETVEEYANYAQSVVEAEKQQIKLPRRLSFFGVSNNNDPATQLSAANLIAPLYQTMCEKQELKGWDYQITLKEEALKSRLTEMIGGKETPGLLFTASHGMSYPNKHKLQLRHNGALLCQDWEGPRSPAGEDVYFSADDISSDAKLWGMISFFFACYGAGTPMLDEFAQQAFKKQRVEIAPRSFTSRLPQRMLAHPKGGALAVLGHVERAWGYSFMWGKAGKQLAVFESTLHRLLDGHPVGSATEYINQRYAELSTVLSDELEEISFNKAFNPLDLSGMWTANNDARNYVVIGDPAVRMMVEDEGAAPVPERASITLREIKIPDEAVNFDPSGAGKSAVVEVPPGDNGGAGGPGAESFAFPGTEKIGDAIKDLSQKLGAFLSDAINQAATLKVRTYTSSNIDQVGMSGDQLTGANLRAMTVIKIDGDIEQVVPVEDGEIDMNLWTLHLETVKQAQAARAELIKSAINTVTSLLNPGAK